MDYKKVLLLDGPGVKLKVDGVNLGAVRTNHPKISQLTLAAIIEKEFPGIFIKIADMKSAGSTNETKTKDAKYGPKVIEVYRVGQDFAGVVDDLKDSGAVIFTNNFTQEAGVVGDLIEFCKKVNSQIRVFMGGSDASVKRGEVDRQAYFYSRGADFVAPLGDGEILLPQLLKNMPVSRTILTDFNKVPNPALHLVDLNQYTQSHEGPLPNGIVTPLMYLETSRGCRQSCDFCGTPFTKGRFRYMNQERIESMLEHYKKAGITSLLLCEDNILSRLDFPNGRKAVVDWFNFMRDNGFVWEFSNGVEIGKLVKNGEIDEELVEVLFGFDGSIGCYRSYIPLERVDALVYRKLKPFDVEKRILDSVVSHGVPLLNLGIIIGNPQETQESLTLTEERMRELVDRVGDKSQGMTHPYINVFLHIPIPGTNDYRRFYEEGRLAFDVNKNPELFNFYTSVVNGENFSCYDLTQLRRELAFRLNGDDAMREWEHTGKYKY